VLGQKAEEGLSFVHQAGAHMVLAAGVEVVQSVERQTDPENNVAALVVVHHEDSYLEEGVAQFVALEGGHKGQREAEFVLAQAHGRVAQHTDPG
jgi:hypothetical protein